MFIALGGNPLAKLSEDEVLRAKTENGSYPAICGRERIHPSLIEPLRAMSSDDPSERWGLEDLDSWLAGKRMTPIPRKTSPKADKALAFIGVEHATARTLARAYSQNVPEAAEHIREGRLEEWLRRGLKDAACADAVADSIEVSKAHESDYQGSDDFLVAKICIFLDREGPFRYRGFSSMPDGFGPALAVEMLRGGEAQIPVEMLSRGIPTMWFAGREGLPSAYPGVERTFGQMRSHLRKPEIGYGFERVLYELSRGLPCQSPLVKEDYAADLGGLLHALDEVSKHVDGKTRPIDRHIAAFIAARADQDVETYLAAIAESDLESSTIGMLSLIALVQWRLGSGPLLGLTSWVGGQLGPAISSYHSRSTRQNLESDIPGLIRQGNLPEIYDFIDNQEKRGIDAVDFNAAQVQFAAAEAEIDEIEGNDTKRAESAEQAGQQTAAMGSIVLTLIAVAILFLMNTW